MPPGKADSPAACAAGSPRLLSRRGFISASLFGPAAAMACGLPQSTPADGPSLITRGVVLVPEDLSLAQWPERARKAGLTTLAIHHQHSPGAVMTWIQSEPGRRFLEQCRRLGLHIEYELHAMKELLPRALFAKAPELFRLDEKGNRNPDSNCCVHSRQALDVIGENALRVARVLRPTTGRYFYWGDDGEPWCRCPRCMELSASEQALAVENHLCGVLRAQDPRAQVAHLAYSNTLTPPRRVAPVRGVFLEYAPINRRYDVPYEQPGAGHADGLESLDANLEVFSRESAQVLEYWLDVSRFSKWKRPAVQLPWRRDVLDADVAAYRKRGIRHITSFAVWIDAEYEKRFGSLDFIDQYGRSLALH